MARIKASISKAPQVARSQPTPCYFYIMRGNKYATEQIVVTEAEKKEVNIGSPLQ